MVKQTERRSYPSSNVLLHITKTVQVCLLRQLFECRRGRPVASLPDVEVVNISLIYFVSADQDEDYFTLEEIKEKLEDEKLGWKSIFKGGLEKIEVEHIEKNLESRASKEEIRYDFTFYTPSCRYVRVKVSLLFQRIC